MRTTDAAKAAPAGRPIRLMGPELFKSLMGGVLMGLANLVPGISGGTMLLVAGVYAQFVDGIAELTTLRFRLPVLLPLGVIAVSAAFAVLFFAGAIKALVIDHRWAMYSLFIGLTLGGVPVIWRLLHAWTLGTTLGLLGGLAVMAALALLEPAASAGGAGNRGYGILFAAGLAGASAMILPGISGGYLLVVLGQYVTILSAIDQFKTALLSAPSGLDWLRLLEPFHVFIPVALGVAAGVAGMSNLIRTLLRRFEGPTYGVLLGLVLGAIVGLWPFQEAVRPRPGDVIRGQVMTTERIPKIKPEDYPLRKYPPTAGQVAASLALIGAGLAVTQLVAFAGRQERAAELGS